MDTSADRNRRILHQATEITIRLALIAALGYWCYLIFRPFLTPVLLAVVIAVALDPVYVRMKRLLRGRAKLAAAALVVLILGLFIGPTVAVSSSLADDARALAATMQQDVIEIPPPPEGVAEWPLVGRTIYDHWKTASENLSAALTQLAPHLKDVGLWLLSTVTGAAVVIVQVLVAIGIAGGMWAYRQRCANAAAAVGARLGGDRGVATLRLATATIHTVARGVVGVAVGQSLLAGAGLFLAGVPAAGLLTMLILVLAVMQFSPLFILAPATIYLIATDAGMAMTIIFAAWTVFITTIDGPLKAYFFSRGVDIPMLVLLIGALGGVLLMGILGLFLGSVILAIGYKLFMAWIDEAEPPAVTSPPQCGGSKDV